MKVSQKNLKYWKPIIKKDRWYDFSFLLTIIEHKINHMILNWDKSIYVDAEQDKAKMIEVRDAIKLFREDNFADKYIEEVDKKHGESKIEFVGIPGSKLHELKTSRNGKPETEEAIADFRKALEKAQKDKDKCRHFIFDTMRDEIEKWWD